MNAEEKCLALAIIGTISFRSYAGEVFATYIPFNGGDIVRVSAWNQDDAILAVYKTIHSNA